jgi:hypothetical protein
VSAALRAGHDILGAREGEADLPEMEGIEGGAAVGGFMVQTSKS